MEPLGAGDMDGRTREGEHTGKNTNQGAKWTGGPTGQVNGNKRIKARVAFISSFTLNSFTSRSVALPLTALPSMSSVISLHSSFSLGVRRVSVTPSDCQMLYLAPV